MKKLFASLLLLTGLCYLAMAVPAHPGKYTYTQPDGSRIVLQNHGDERFHWTTDESGNVVALDEDGFYRITTLDAVREEQQAKYAEGETYYAGAWSSHDEPYATNFGDRKVLAVLVNFKDLAFTLDNPRQKFENMLNQEGYSYNGAHGSVRDYYIDNSLGQYRPQFDVYGPVTLSRNMAYYDDNGGTAYGALLEALAQLNIDFGQYDTDKDGCIDMALMYYAGYNEAEGGPADSIWPHQGSGRSGSIGGYRLPRYFCTSEYRGYTGSGEMCGIGTTCHEFAHALGLPDMYDTNYEGNGQNSMTTGSFDLMAHGNYNNAGRCPPYLSAVERNMLGWMDDITPFNGAGEYTLYPVSQNKAYTSSANMSGEYFVYEYRPKSGWDAFISNSDWYNATNGGLLIYHVDKSQRLVIDNYSAEYLWTWTNSINAIGGHPCYYLKESSESCYFFPGRTNVTEYTPLDWDDNNAGLKLTSIAVNENKATFTLQSLTQHVLSGRVTDSHDAPLAGATVVLSRSAYALNAASSTSLLPTDLSTTTASDGSYSFDLAGNNRTDFVLSVRKAGYISQTRNISFPVEDAGKVEDFALNAYNGDGTLANYGVAFIEMNVDVPNVVTPYNKSVRSITWKVDGNAVGSPTAKSALAAGSHNYQATVSYYDGSSERVYLFVEVE